MTLPAFFYKISDVNILGKQKNFSSLQTINVFIFFVICLICVTIKISEACCLNLHLKRQHVPPSLSKFAEACWQMQPWSHQIQIQIHRIEPEIIQNTSIKWRNTNTNSPNMNTNWSNTNIVFTKYKYKFTKYKYTKYMYMYEFTNILKTHSNGYKIQKISFKVVFRSN